MFPDIELVLVTYLKAQNLGRVVTELPANLADVAPVIQVGRISGADDDFRLDQAVVDIDVYAVDRATAWAVSEQVRGLLKTDLRGQVVANAVVTSATTVAGPRWLAYDDTSVRRYSASYQLFAHTA